MCFETRPWPYDTGRRRRELMIMIVSIRQKKGEIHKVAVHRRNKKKLVFLSFMYVGIGESAPRLPSSSSSQQTEQDICRREQNKEDENEDLFLSFFFTLRWRCSCFERIYFSFSFERVYY